MIWSSLADCSWLLHLPRIQWGPSSLGGGDGHHCKTLFRLSTRWKLSSHFIKEDFKTYQICFPPTKGPSDSILISRVSKEKSFTYLFFKKEVQVFLHLKLLYWLQLQQFPQVGTTRTSNSTKGWIRLLPGKQRTPAQTQSQMKSPCYWIECPSKKKTYKTFHQSVHLDAIET